MPYRVWPTATTRAKPSGGGVVAQPGTGRLTITGLASSSVGVFPLSVSSNGRYLQQADGTPFLVVHEAAWSLMVQLTRAEVVTYLDSCVAKGFNAIVVNLIEHYFSDTTNAWTNQEGYTPFTTMTDFAAPNENYWGFVDYVVQQCYSRGILLIANPAYSGYPATEQGWDTEYSAETDADLQSYGAFLANRYAGYENILWCGAGDKTITGTEQTKQLNIFQGIRSVDANALVTGHGTTNSNTREFWSSSYTSVDLIYRWVAYGNIPADYCRSSWDLTPAKPVFNFEPQYEYSQDAAGCRRDAYAGALAGSIGCIPYGNWPIWHFSASVSEPATAWQDALSDTGRTQMIHARNLFTGFQWWKLEPKDNTSVISSALGSGTGKVWPALASDGTFAFIWVPSSQTVTLVKSAFSPALIRVRLYDPTNGSYSTHTASTSNTGTLSVATGGERIIVVDAA